MKVISNSSPLIVLHNCGQLGILQQIFGQVLIPEAVYHEVVHNTKNRQQSDDKRAQKEARLQGITFIPTFAVLLKAAQKGIISDFDAVLAELALKNIFLSRDLNLAAKSFLDLNRAN